MGRKRYVSSEICTDESIAAVAAEDQVAALMWPWVLTAFDDWGRMAASAVKIKLAVFPAFDISPEQIERAITLWARAGLVHVYEVDGHRYMAIDPRKWYRYQTYIKAHKRAEDGSSYPPPPDAPWDGPPARTSAGSSADARTSAQRSEHAGVCVPSPSPSPSPSLAPSPPPLPTDAASRPEETPLADPDTRAPAADAACESGKPKGARARDRPEYSAEFEEFWAAYPRHVEKRRAWRCWQARLREGRAPEALIRAARNYADYCRQAGVEERYRKHASTFLGPDRPFLEWTEPRSPPQPARVPRAWETLREYAQKHAGEVEGP